MNPRLRDFLVGVTSIVALGGFASLLLLFGELALLWQERYPIVVRANTSAGLRVGSQVTVNGVVVGTITAVSLDMSNIELPVKIDAVINEPVDLPLAAVPSVGISLLGGGQRLDLVIPKGWAKGDPIADKRIASTLNGRFETLTEVVGRLNAVLDEARTAITTAQGALERGSAAFDTVGATFDRAGSTIDRVNEVLAHADAWLSDDQMREDVRGMLFSAKQATATISRIVERMETDAPAFMANLTRAADEVSRTLESVTELLRQAREGDGTVGRLMQNPDLYESLNDAAKRLTSVLRQAQLLIEKVKQEGLDLKF